MISPLPPFPRRALNEPLSVAPFCLLNIEIRHPRTRKGEYALLMKECLLRKISMPFPLILQIPGLQGPALFF